MSNVELGSGLIAIGRQWGTTPEVPSESDALRFLEAAYQLGIRFFDTAPSYGLSEERLGKFLQNLTPNQRREVVVATKFGEHWDAGKQEAYTDHSLEALRRSLDQSMHHLGQVAILQLHKTTPELLDDPDVIQAFAYAQELGIGRRGVSVSDLLSAARAMEDQRYEAIQLPYNQSSLQFQPFVRQATEHDKFLLINRPFQMGHVTAETATIDKQLAAANAFHFILQEEFDGVILTGTSNIAHLQENIAAFEVAKSL